MDDLFDREMVLEEMSCTRPSPKDRPQYLQWLADIKAILKVPLVKTDRKRGHYIKGKNGERYCSECKRIDDKYSGANFCWYCGADMRGDE